ncbi:S8 family serine peptidase [Mucilaginibacter xinganensis]|uniref:Cell wall-associated protease n=1 Tax=Mucilaginibacter xinganensis TaxID=1234841 RepID=A0A223NX78_9SPHI|nr:S8 family serine peptidase [Mucilaginibacter xinganensis]ASU34161.1 Cell wall-associated protease precursor [Mucilaginibacter xinganensis]
MFNYRNSIHVSFSYPGKLIIASLILLNPFITNCFGQKLKNAPGSPLPIHTYPITDSLNVLLADRNHIRALKEQLKKDLLSDLGHFEIRDTAVLKSYYRILGDLAFYERNNDQALAYYDTLRTLEVKPAAQATSALVKRSLIASGDPESADYMVNFHAVFTKKINAIAYESAASSLQRIRQQYANLTAAEYVKIAASDLNPPIANGPLSIRNLDYVLFLFYEMHDFDKVSKVVTLVMDSVTRAAARKQVNIWPARELTLPPGKPYTPVVICVFDLGTDISVFKDRLYTNKKEKIDGLDNDHNSYVDDVHGVAYDLQENKDSHLLMPLTAERQKSYPDAVKLLKGYGDDEAGIESTEFRYFKDVTTKANVVQRDSIWNLINLVADYVHGTHVAGIAMRGNPYARLLTVRFSEDVGFTPDAKSPAVETELKVAKNLKDLVKYWKAANVRVVTMSWGYFISDYQTDIAKYNPKMPADEQKNLAVKLWTMRKNALYEAFSSAPGILFVASNGNKNSNSDMDLRYPAALDIPNMIGVGSVNSAGLETDFTATGKKVAIHANGYLVESFAPGGSKILLSGTSMATPYIANLAAKLIAMKPSLSPAEVITLIKKGADISADGRIKLVNPKRSFELLTALK